MAVVLDHELHVVARRHGNALLQVGLFEPDVLRRDHELAPFGHRVAGIHDEVDEDLFDLIRVRLDPRRSRIELEGDDDVFLDQSSDELVCVLGEAIDREDLRFQDLLSGEGQ